MSSQLLQPILLDLNSFSKEILASAVVYVDGLPLATEFARGAKRHQTDRMGAMAVSLLALGARAAKELLSGHTEWLMMKGGEGFLLLMKATDEMVLLVQTKDIIQMDAVLAKVRHTAQVIAQELEFVQYDPDRPYGEQWVQCA